jgi:hypothetical protein
MTDEDTNADAMQPCFNPSCDNRVVVGVCWTCSRNGYEPRTDGVEIAGTVTRGWGDRQTKNPSAPAAARNYNHARSNQNQQ